jgi:uncharacterized protein with HEPN domain
LFNKCKAQRPQSFTIRISWSTIDDLKEITDGLTCETFLQRRVNMHALKDVLRDISEAVWAVSKNKRVKELFYYYHIPFDKLSLMRHELTHEYFSVNWPSLWNTATNELPTLQNQFSKVLADL